MKTSSKILMVLGAIITIVGMLVFRNLQYVNAVDGHAWTININGINSFPWITFTGGLFIVIGIIFYISSLDSKGKRYN
ncbi:hypothetical protein CPT03_07235 [Pedobacter ginsengisoli]|uniref:Uncharacterized protein n=1 Tax=Pedobacter ginsengisoli TaxID=363852 RepID=A0A2D1U3T8_9SPHI|nr:hypothetical protein [Pedobacter ginsengisoli]ATP56279.1 hypothetical protein CPT03_07235 [Pedobacter ginsengisoli]